MRKQPCRVIVDSEKAGADSFPDAEVGARKLPMTEDDSRGGPPEAARAPRRVPKQHLTAIGVGTQGLGPSAGGDRAEAAFREWKRNKPSTGSHYHSSLPQLSPREYAARQKELVSEARSQHAAQQRTAAVATQAESKELLARATQERGEQLNLRREHIDTRKAQGSEARQAALAAHDDSKNAALRETKEAMRKEREANRAMLEETRRIERERIDEAKAQVRQLHEQSKQQAERQKADRLEAIRREKARDADRLGKWKNEVQHDQVLVTQLTSELRRTLTDGTAASREMDQQQRSMAVKAAKDELQKAQALLDQRRQARDEQLKKEIELTKAAQASQYADRLEEVAAQKRDAAEELRARKAASRRQIENDREQRRNEARDLKVHVAHRTRSTSPTR
jgi:hypothetical protein